MSNNKDFKVKNGIQPTVYHEGLGTVVSGSVGYSLANASYDNVSFSVSSQDTNPYGIVFNSDGTKLFMVGGVNDFVYQYSLSTGFDLSTASYDNVSFSVGSQETTPMQINFNSDGTKMFIIGNTNDNVYQYSLSTGFDLSTASYDSISFSVVSQDIGPYGATFSSDGTKMFVVGVLNLSIFQYSLSTAFDLSTASYDSVSFDISSEDTDPRGLTFNQDGTLMYIVGDTNNSIFQYSLSTGFDLSTATYDAVNFSVGSQDSSAWSVRLSNDGTKMFVLGTTTDTIYQYSTALITAELDLSTGSVFEVTPTSDVQVTLSNPAASGTVSGATLLLTGGAVDTAGVGEVFSTSLYEGNGSTQPITNGIDLDGEGGLVWLKDRFSASLGFHTIYDTEGGTGPDGGRIFAGTAGTNGRSTQADGLQSFDSTGFTLGANIYENGTGKSFASWTFRKAPKFFDVQTFTTTYNFNPNVISHNLGGEVGCAIFKQTATTSQGINWIVYHKALGTGKYLRLNDTASVITDSQSFTAVDTNTISFGYPMGVTADRLVSGSDETTNWVGYFFANDTAAGSRIKCGSYVGGGSTDVEINLGWQPQWLLIRRSDAAGDWFLVDSERGFGIDGVDTAKLKANSSEAETTSTSLVATTLTGFKTTDNNAGFNSAGGTYIYIAIRGTYTPTITYDPTLEWPGGTAPTAPDIGETDVVTFNTRDGGSTYQGVLAIDGAK